MNATSDNCASPGRIVKVTALHVDLSGGDGDDRDDVRDFLIKHVPAHVPGETVPVMYTRGDGWQALGVDVSASWAARTRKVLRWEARAVGETVAAPAPAPVPRKAKIAPAPKSESADADVDMDVILAHMAKNAKAMDLQVTKDSKHSTAAEKAAAKAEIDKTSSTGQSVGADGRDVITINDRLDAMADGLVPLLADESKTPNLYQRGGALADIVMQPRKVRGGGTVLAPTLRDLPEAQLDYLVGSLAAFEKTMGTGKKRKEPCPPRVLKMVLSAGAWHGIRPIASVIACPIVRSDGEVRTTAGYDPETHSFLTADVTTSPIGETAEDATEALRTLMGLLVDFPFKDRPRGQAVWLSALLTRLTRGQYGTAPMFLARGNCPKTGKGTLVDLICLIADGERPSPMAYSADDTAMAKTLHADLRAGADVILLDNIPERFPVESAVLAIALTADKFKSRVLNLSENEAPENQATWFMTGNGTALSREIARRTLNMDLFTDRPAGVQVQYTIKGINKHVRERRGEYLAAVLTVYRAWVRAGKPVQDVPSLDSFDDWSDSVRQCVLWAATLPGMGLHLSDPVQASDVTGTDEVCAHGRLCLLVSDVLAQRKVAGLSAADMLADLSGAGPSGAVKALTEFMRGTEEKFPANPSFWSGKILGTYDVSKKGRVLCADGATRWLYRGQGGLWRVGCEGAPVKAPPPAKDETATAAPYLSLVPFAA